MAELGQQRLEHRAFEVHGDSFAEEQRGLGGFVTGGGQRGGHGVDREVGGDERDVSSLDLEAIKALTLVSLRVGVVDLEPAHAGLRVAQRPTVIPRGGDHHLAHAAIKGADHDAVEERRAGGQVGDHRCGGLDRCGAGDVTSQALVGRRIARGGLDPLEPEPVGRHPAGGHGRFASSHLNLCPNNAEGLCMSVSAPEVGSAARAGRQWCAIRAPSICGSCGRR